MDLVRPTGDEENGTFATEKIQKGTLLIRMPINACLRGTMMDVATKLEAALETEKNPYLDTLPDGLGTWTDDEKALLRGTSLEHFPEQGRALRLVRSRAVQLEEWILAPGIDALNHSTHRNAQLYVDDATLDMVAIKDIMKGDEITHLYDDILTPADSVARYGVVLDSSTPAPVFVDLRTDFPSDRILTARRLILRGDAVIAITVVDPLPDALLEVISLLLLPPDDFMTALEFEGLDLLATFDAAPTDFRTAVYALLVDLADRKLTAFESSSLLLPTSPSSSSSSSPGEYRRRQRRLQAALQVRDAERAPWLALRQRATSLYGEEGSSNSLRVTEKKNFLIV